MNKQLLIEFCDKYLESITPDQLTSNKILFRDNITKFIKKNGDFCKKCLLSNLDDECLCYSDDKTGYTKLTRNSETYNNLTYELPKDVHEFFEYINWNKIKIKKLFSETYSQEYILKTEFKSPPFSGSPYIWDIIECKDIFYADEWIKIFSDPTSGNGRGHILVNCVKSSEHFGKILLIIDYDEVEYTLMDSFTTFLTRAVYPKITDENYMKKISEYHDSFSILEYFREICHENESDEEIMVKPAIY